MALDATDEHCDVLVLGAGAAGIGAARRLLEEDDDDENNLKVVILEARHRVGGRAWTSDELRCGDLPGGSGGGGPVLELDHGGKWIHGADSDDPPNPMTELAARYEISTTAWGHDHTIEFRERRRRRRNIKRVLVTDYGEGTGENSMRSVAPSQEAEAASRILFKQFSEFGRRNSLIVPLKNELPLETSYKDCLLEIANREMPGASFADWLEGKARAALLAASSCEHPAEKPSRLRIAETIALLRHRMYWEMESYEGCRLDRCSLLHAMDGTILDGNDAVVAGGYGGLVRTLATTAGDVPVDVRCGHRVISVDRTTTPRSDDDRDDVGDSPRGVVTVVCTVADEEGPNEARKRFVARLGCIVALPLGVLQHPVSVSDPADRDPEFVPPLPENLLGAVDRLGMCLMNKIEILFPSRWWPEGTGSLTIASEKVSRDDNGNDDDDDDFPLGDMPWPHWIVEEDDPPVLVCYATGAFAERVETMSNEDVEREAAGALRLAFLGAGEGTTDDSSDYDDEDDDDDNDNNNDNDEERSQIPHIPDPLRTNVTRWRSDPFARGSWTFLKAGSRGMEDVRAFREFNSTRGGAEGLYFAGEHTCDGGVDGLDIGTVHGAYLSGTLAAEELLLQNRTNLES